MACDGALELGQLEARRFELMGPVADPLGDGGDSSYSAAGGVTATVDAGVHDRCVVAVAKAAYADTRMSVSGKLARPGQ